MNIILLSGGSGKRLWPLSNDIRSKQFIKLFKNENDVYESMVQRVYRQIKTVDQDANISIATGKSQVSAILNQVGHDASICVEPARRDTFPAIALAAAFLHSVKGVELDEVAIICPVDPYVNNDYFEALSALNEFANSNKANLTLMGVEPTFPSEKYGYIIPETDEKYSSVSAFKEKPTQAIAREYIAQGALWNCGVFAFKLGYVLEIAEKLIGYTAYEDMYNNYEKLEKISFDYAVVEKESNIDVMRFAGDWKDIGTWNTLADEMSEAAIGNAILNETCENTHVINELNIPILCMGLKNMVVSASGDGILVSDIEESARIKPFVSELDDRVKYAEKSWGKYEVIDVDNKSMTIKITLESGNQMSYHNHERRDEVWTVISGTGRAIIDGEAKAIKPGDVITMQAGSKHMVIADDELKIMEVQIGEEINVHDKQKYEYEGDL